MDVKKLQEYIEANGNIFKNYRVLCEVIGIEPKSGGDQRRAQLKEIEMFIKLSNGKGHKLIVSEIYNTPKPDHNKKYPKNFYEASPTIFIVTNLINKKSYIGHTSRKMSLVVASFKGGYPDINAELNRDLIEYGVDAFSFKILESNPHPKTINEKRKFYISAFNTIEYGYNVRLSNFTYRNSLLTEGRVSGMKNNGVESNVNSNKHNSDEEYNDKNIAKLNLFLLINNAQYYVYCFFNKYGEAIYVGKTNNLTYRMIDHFNNGHLSDEVYDEVTSVEYQILLSKVEMDIMELYYINKWKPKHNTMNKSNERVSITIDNKNRWYKYNIHQRSHDNLIENNLEK